ncbi:MAG TPA: phosphomannomutase/phosphoglucomutase [Polyangia bacterium]|jgi:phosphomannomutase/phosphoglucomutase|nr:phosphomannomutase/phosphoglucomutase [Polyangia bacterium]
MAMNPRVFREYDIRGVAETDFTDDFVADLGRATGAYFAEAGARRVTLGRDCRISSPRIHATFKRELLASGLDVVDVGVVHSPGLYFSVFHLGVDGGVMITASHNPSEDNGFKIVCGKSTIYGAEIQKLRERIERRAFRTGVAPGRATEHDIITDYVAYIADNIKLGPRRFKVVVDGGNGTGGISALPTLRRLGVETEAIYCDPDGRFPNHHPDPTVPENLADLIARVGATGAEVGIALDGDADRIGAVDGQGRILWGDQLVMLFGREILQRQPGATFVSEVKCSQALFDELTRLGGRAIMWKVGHSLIKAKMKEEKAALAGEMSGHMFFADRWFGFDDAVYAGMRLVELLSHSTLTLAELYDTLPVLHNTPEIRMPCPDDVKFEVVRRAVAWFRERYSVVDVDGARVIFQEDDQNVGWGLVRASNTGPVLVMRFEADSPARLAEIKTLMEDRLRQIIADVAAAS